MAKSANKSKPTKKKIVPKKQKAAPKPASKFAKKGTSKSAQKPTSKTTAKKSTLKAVKPLKVVPKKTKSATEVAKKPTKPLGKKTIKKIDKKAPIRSASSKSVTRVETPAQRLTKTYLSKEELKHFQQILLEKRTEVLKDLEIMRTSLQDENNSEEINSSYSMHMADHGTETLDREQRFMFIARDERYLGYIDKALERIKHGTYGICAKSGLPIPKERLEAVPHTAVRIEYKNR